MFRVGFYQFAPRFGRVEENLAAVLHALADVHADLVVLPELPFTGYLFENRRELARLAGSFESAHILEALSNLCRARDFYLVTGFAEMDQGRIFNSAVLVGPSGVLMTYRKLHLFNTEKEYFDAGDRPLQVFEVRGVNVGMMVCFDWAFPEVSRTLALKGADLICHPSNLVLTYCQDTMRARCIENGVYAVTCNRYGTEFRPRGGLAFTGQSQVVGPKGEVMARAASDKDALMVVQIDADKARDKSITDANDLLGDRRPEFYRALM